MGSWHTPNFVHYWPVIVYFRVQKTQDKATCTSDEEIYRIAYTYDNSASEGYSTDGGEWINYADAYESGVENVGFSNTTTV